MTSTNTEQREVNIPLLRKAVEWAEVEAARPEGECQWDQGWFINRPLPRETRACGTRYCIAGWTLHADGWTDDAIDEVPDPAAHAADALGIPRWNGHAAAGSHLFADGNTIEDVRRIAESLAGERL